jgi:Concanavalin A-like lectin/glucanases superfamily/Domain of unknown function (DUF2341)/Carbohydrate esterase, sialic acid-specific acetylesterase
MRQTHFFSLFIFCALMMAWPMTAAEQSGKAASYAGWSHVGSLFILTTPEGANLPASVAEEGFPLLVSLNKDFFDFKQAKANGEDIRFTSVDGAPLVYQIEEWNVASGTASIWVRIPTIKGNARQEIKMHWGKTDANSESDGAAVFNESNGYLSVWHMDDTVKDEVGTLESKNVGTTATAGLIGVARHFGEGQGIFCGDKITKLPVGSSPHSTEAWFRATATNGTIVAWGNDQQQGKLVLKVGSPPHVYADTYFSNGNVAGESALPKSEWIHVAHTYTSTGARIYVNGVLDGTAKGGASMDVKNPARLWIGGWYNSYSFSGDIDEVRLSKVARSADWLKMQYENQKPRQTLVGPIVQTGTQLSLTSASATVLEGKNTVVTAQAGGAQKIYWTLSLGGKESVVATDRFSYSLEAGRVTADVVAKLTFKAVYATAVKTKDISITIKEDIADPAFTMKAPTAWDGRTEIEFVPQISNLSAMQSKGAGEVKTEWSVTPFAVIKEIVPGKLILKRSQNSGPLTITATMNNGGHSVSQSAIIQVTEPKKDAWVARTPTNDEKPQDGQFYARDEKNEGTLYYNGTLTDAAESVFLKVYADDKPYKTETAKPAADKSYAFAVKLKPGLIKYKVEFGSKVGDKDVVMHTVSDLVCGDAYIIEGQSNGLATDTREKSPPLTSEWIRSYGRPSENPKEAKNNLGNLWCLPVWKAEKGEKAELGWWGMELAKRLLDSQKMPIFMLNAAVGGTRIDQHQRSAVAPTDLTTIYGRMLWRVQQAKLTHGIRGILWHQGESDQGSDGPTGGFGWETYQQLFIDMSAGWKQDFPNVQHYYVFQIWPNACSMGGNKGSGDMLREKLRTLPQLYSHMSIMSTLGTQPPGGCHFPLAGWAEFARTIQPLIERDHYGKVPTTSITPASLKRAAFAAGSQKNLVLEFDQPVVWTANLAGQFYLDGEKDKVASGSVTGNILTLTLKEASSAKLITYLKETAWSQDNLLMGANGIAALTFCKVPIEGAAK